MPANASMAWGSCEKLLVVVHAPRIPDEADWAQFMEDVQPVTVRWLLVVAGDARLSPKQRSDMHEWFKRIEAEAAVLTNSQISRGIVTALRWFGVPVRAFAEDDFDKALDALDVPQHLRKDGDRLFGELDRALTRARAPGLSHG